MALHSLASLSPFEESLAEEALSRTKKLLHDKNPAKQNTKEIVRLVGKKLGKAWILKKAQAITYSSVDILEIQDILN